ncbi:hypothetical protein CgunFtcFv8_011328 [Champsocephalus gunnari]|uniref:Uncharacterized protein n=1 Tax=Champsocephalus gunnari TaxID=52237 RepID=A0AAN8D9L5_CHAGU|nr:hypothetical protein CgunFtcFv8_011328 [Champsocephalus gunnari]
MNCRAFPVQCDLHFQHNHGAFSSDHVEGFTMDTFVTETLTAWQLENLIDTFKDQEVDEESFRLLDAIASLIPNTGHRVKFQKCHKELENCHCH